MPKYVIDVKCEAHKTVLVEASSKSEARKIAVTPFANIETTAWGVGLPISCGPAYEQANTSQSVGGPDD